MIFLEFEKPRRVASHLVALSSKTFYKKFWNEIKGVFRTQLNIYGVSFLQKSLMVFNH